MENHLRSHKDYEIYGCEVCDKKVSLKWRMEKHVQCHNKITKFCHYHNNEKHCPCNDIGCKFKHEYSNQCRFGDKASSKKNLTEPILFCLYLGWKASDLQNWCERSACARMLYVRGWT